MGRKKLSRHMVKRGYKERPKGIWLLLIFFAFGIIFFIPILASDLTWQWGQWSDMLNLPRAISILSILFLLFLMIASSIGMWVGKPWGWWVVTFYFAYSIVLQSNSLLVVPSAVAQLAQPQESVEMYYLRYGFRIIWNVAIIAYLYRVRVLAYFELSHLSKAKAILGLLGTIVVLLVLTILFRIVSARL